MQRCVRRNRTHARRSVAKLRRDDEFALAADFHARHTEIPSLDYPPRAEHEAEWSVAMLRRSVKHRTVVEGAR